MSQMTIEVRNFRVLEHLKWSPSGLCLLSGPNGAGKSTTIRALKFVKFLFEVGHEGAFKFLSGRHFKKLGVPLDEPVEFQVVVGDIRWTTRFPMTPKGINGTYGEELWHGDELILRAVMNEEGFHVGSERRRFDDTRCCAKWLWDRSDSPWMVPLVEQLGGIRVHESYVLDDVKSPEELDPRATILSRTGKNLWSVLLNWKASPKRFKGQFEWVMSETIRAFPDLVSAIEFDRGLPLIYSPGAHDIDDALPPVLMADGLLVGLLHLTAVAGAPEGSILAFDEMENQLHPHAIRSILHAMRMRAEERNLTIILTTHSPVVMNDFRDEPEQVYVLDRSEPGRPVPIPMSELHSEEWLAQSKLGTLYEHLAFGAPPLESKP